MRIFGPIKDIGGLKALYAKASELGLIGVGITDSGNAYKFNPKNGMSVPMHKEDVKAALSIDDLQYETLIQSKGDIDFEEAAEVVVDEEVKTPETFAEEDVEVVEVNIEEDVVIEKPEEEVVKEAPFQEDIQSSDSPGETREEVQEEKEEEQSDKDYIISDLAERNGILEAENLRLSKILELIKELIL